MKAATFYSDIGRLMELESQNNNRLLSDSGACQQ